MSNYEELFLDVHGVKTRILKGGSGPPLVYWHGAGGGEMWFAHHAMLSEHFTVYAPDHPGWGGSDNAEWMDTIHDYVLHYDSVFRQLNIERPILVGHSLGGWMAAEFATTYPDRLAALVLVNAAGFPFDDEPVPDFFAAAARGGPEFAQLVFHKMDVAMQFFPLKPTPEDILQTFRHLTATARIAWHVWFDDKMPQRLKRLTGTAQRPSGTTRSPFPTVLVLWGAHDRIFPVSLGHKYADAIPGATFKVFDDCGHMVPFENPSKFVEEIKELNAKAQSR